MTTPLNEILGKGNETPAPEKQPETETNVTAQVQETPEQPQDGGEQIEEADVGGRKMVPKAALDEARGKVKRYTEQVADFDRKLTENNTSWERRFNTLLERLAPQPQQPKQEEPPDFFADPDAALRARLSPLEAKMHTVSQALTLRASKAEAVASYGREAVAKMETDLNEAMTAGDPELPSLREAMLATDDPVGLAMSWHQRRSVLKEVGTDPSAYREKLKAEILAELQQNGGDPPAQAGNGAVMPSNLTSVRNVGNRSGPAWAGPTPITDIFNRKRPA